ncbi:Ku protein [Streptomyces sp. RLB3-17]|uniref:non-homologous end joining protein Ku n=1 Tax=unclassified Streptomyces TaxID=2593676 RepID=UPI001163656F|nr:MULTISPECIES: Ku protein [unclassified Streptomyces]QDN75818.1 Ku protein [Streptomyces sp. S1A1-7]QDO06322.1 Ku protein [Streptomyces sp. S1D4-23]QDO17811.1 Ku protein [Streptomyces sp. S1A1-8]QDO27938.1 Ku protein [Streptomyces sp. S1A1-3]QDO37818.1 Ku protein [Streptomyces sp. RLB3-17]
MPRPLWSGAISFGLVTIPVKLLSATEDRSVRFHQVHTEDLGRVRVRKYCETEDREVSAAEIGKGYEVSKDTLVAVTDEELEQMPLPTAKAIEIVAFVPAASIDPVRLSGDSYFLKYDGQVAAKPYALIARALARNTKVAVAKLAWHGRERLVLLRVRDGALVAHVLKWDDEVRDPSELAPKDITVTDSEIDEALLLVDSMTTDDISGYQDEYRKALEAVIEAKAEGRQPPEPSTEADEPGGQVVDLMAALQESVRKAQAARDGDAGDAEVHEMPKKTATTRKTAGKASAKKTAKKKTAAKKPGRGQRGA